MSVWLSSAASNQGWWANTPGRRLQEIQRHHGLYQNALLNTSHFPNPRPPPASRTVRAPPGPGAWLRLVDPCSGLAPRGRPPANQAWGRCPGRSPRLPGGALCASAVPEATLPACGVCCPTLSGPGEQAEHGLGHCGSSKTDPRPNPFAPPGAWLPDGKGCLWLSAKEAREPGTPRRPGAPPRSGMGPGRGPADWGSGAPLPGLPWGAAVGEIGLQRACV